VHLSDDPLVMIGSTSLTGKPNSGVGTEARDRPAGTENMQDPITMHTSVLPSSVDSSKTFVLSGSGASRG